MNRENLNIEQIDLNSFALVMVKVGNIFNDKTINFSFKNLISIKDIVKKYQFIENYYCTIVYKNIELGEFDSQQLINRIIYS